MKINGEALGRPNEEVIVFPRSDDKDIVFTLKSILNMEIFEEQFPPPQPPAIIRRGETVATPDYEDKKYNEKMGKFGQLKSKWMLIKSLEATKGLEWETVNPSKPETWQLLDTELRESGLNQVEILKLYQTMMKVNSLDEEYLEEARKRFFESQRDQKV